MLQPICHLLDRPKCFRLGRASPVGICTRGFNVPWQGTHNNLCEQALKKAILHRKNSLFYKTRRGAFVGGPSTGAMDALELSGPNGLRAGGSGRVRPDPLARRSVITRLARPLASSHGPPPRNSTAALLIHAKNSEENRFPRWMPLENVFLLIPVLHHIVNGEA